MKDSLKGESFLKNDWPRFKGKCYISEDWSLPRCMETFFTSLDEYTRDSHRELHKHFYIGPTFYELKMIMASVWKPEPAYQPQGLHGRLSELLEQYVDHGFVTSVISENGDLIYIKSDAWPILEDAFHTLQLMGLDLDPTCDIRSLVRSLPQKDKDDFIQIMYYLEDTYLDLD